MAARSKARKRALDILFASELRSEDPVMALERAIEAGEGPTNDYTATLVRGVVEHQSRIDEVLTTYSKSWTLARMPAVDRNVLRIGVYELLWGDDDYLDEDVLCVGDSDEGKAVAMELAKAVTGREGISAGKLRLARQLEPFTAVLISINRKYKAHSGLRITGIPGRD